MSRPIAFLLVLCLGTIPVLGQQKQAASQKKLARVGGAQWSQSVQTFLGVDNEHFANSGLLKLTKEELGKLLQTAMDASFTISAELDQSKLILDCAPKPARQNPDTVRVFIPDVGTNTPPELMSGLRTKLRSIRDIEIVYDRMTADVEIDLLGFADELQNGVTTGYTASVVTLTPCRASYVGKTWDDSTEQSHNLFTSATVDGLIQSVFARLDSDTMEKFREIHAAERNASPSVKAQ